MKKKRNSVKRLTVTLGSGQRKALEAFAERNDITLAFAVRYAITLFIEKDGGGRLQLK